MIFEVHQVSSPLDQWIEHVFYFKGFAPDHSVEKVVPTGNVFILIELDGMERNTLDDELNPIARFRNSWISGMQQKSLNISAHQNSEMMAVQLKPIGAYPFFKIPAYKLNNLVEQADIYFSDSIVQLRSRIIAEQSIPGKFRLTEQWLLELFDENKIPPREITDVVEKLQNQPFIRHSDLLKDYPKTSKNLISQFRKYIGLTPKNLHRIFRFNTLLAVIKQKKEIVWTDIVYETGYTDQSHFIKEFKEFSGFNPSHFIKHGYNDAEPNFFPLDR